MRNSWLALAVLALLLGACLLAGLRVGSYDTSWSTAWRALFTPDYGDPAQFAIRELRLPRLLLAFAVGGSLALSGYLIQALVNNALADPYILGSAAGASLGAHIAYFGLVPLYVAGLYLPPALAFAGALGVTLLVVILGSYKGQFQATQLLLAGIAVNALIGAFISLLTFLSDSEGKLRTIIFWTMGGFEKASWDNLGYPFLTLLISLVFFLLMQKRITLLLLGSTRAETMGLNVRSTRWIILIGTSMVTGCAVALSGPIGFVGLIVPHLVRALFGITGPLNLLLCVFTGGLLLMASDLISRLIYPPGGVPVGIITALFGVPFFLFLLIRKRYSFS